MKSTRNSTQKRCLALFTAIIMALTLWTAVPLTASADESYTLTYSEGGLILGSANVDNNAYAETTVTTYTINLTSPVGAATERYFTTSDTVTADETHWALSDGIAGASLSVVKDTNDKTYKVSIPADATGTATLTVGSYAITFNVTADVLGSNALDPGETFAADGIEWRVLMKDGNNSLVIAEHVLESRAYHNKTPYPTWESSDIRTYLSGTFLNTLSTLSTNKIIEKTDIQTRSAAYGNDGSFAATTDEVFLLGIEEVYYAGADNVTVGTSASTGTSEQRTNGNTVIFADDNARKAVYITSPTGGTSSYWWLRSPSYGTNAGGASDVGLSTGGLNDTSVTNSRGVRPALWLNLPYTLTVESGTDNTAGSPYEDSASVSITANDPPDGQVFDKWTTTNGGSFSPNATSAEATFTMPANATTVTANYRWATPNAAIDYANETLTGLAPNATYSFNDSEDTADSEGNYEIPAAWMDEVSLSITRMGADSVADSDPQSGITIPARPETPEIESVNETVAGANDGKITGVDTDMEYKLDDAEATGWTAVTGQMLTEGAITVPAGDYLVRVAAVEEESFASLPAEVTVESGANLTVTVPTFESVKDTYTESPGALPITITNSGNSAAAITGVTVPGNADFVIGGSGDTVGPIDGSITTWTVQPKAGLGVGTHTATITVAYNGTVIMEDVTFTVNATYAVTVTGGAGSGSYEEDETVSITAQVPSGQVFVTWTSDDENVDFASATSPETTFTMPAEAVTVTAVYKLAPVTPPTTYVVTVAGGTGSGLFEEGATVTITANAAAEGKVFDTWTTNDGVIFANANSTQTSFTMPDKAVTVTATYADDPQGTGGDPTNPTVTDGWVYDDGVWKYLASGVAQTGWFYDDAWYYLNADGIMQTGWIYDSNYKAWYYLAGNGAMKTGWVKDDGNWYYLAGNGAMVWGKWLHDIDGNWYYLSGNGKMLTGKQTISGKVYSFKTNGVWVS